MPLASLSRNEGGTAGQVAANPSPVKLWDGVFLKYAGPDGRKPQPPVEKKGLPQKQSTAFYSQSEAALPATAGYGTPANAKGTPKLQLFAAGGPVTYAFSYEPALTQTGGTCMSASAGTLASGKGLFGSLAANQTAMEALGLKLSLPKGNLKKFFTELKASVVDPEGCHGIAVPGLGMNPSMLAARVRSLGLDAEVKTVSMPELLGMKDIQVYMWAGQLANGNVPRPKSIIALYAQMHAVVFKGITSVKGRQYAVIQDTASYDISPVRTMPIEEFVSRVQSQYITDPATWARRGMDGISILKVNGPIGGKQKKLTFSIFPTTNLYSFVGTGNGRRSPLGLGSVTALHLADGTWLTAAAISLGNARKAEAQLGNRNIRLRRAYSNEAGSVYSNTGFATRYDYGTDISSLAWLPSKRVELSLSKVRRGMSYAQSSGQESAFSRAAMTFKPGGNYVLTLGRERLADASLPAQKGPAYFITLEGSRNGMHGGFSVTKIGRGFSGGFSFYGEI